MKHEHNLNIFMQDVNQYILNKSLWSYLHKREYQTLLKKNMPVTNPIPRSSESKHSPEKDRRVITDPADTIIKYTLTGVPSV